MVHLHKKKIKGHTYYYIRETRWIDGTSKVIWQKYLGNVEKILKVFNQYGQAPSVRVSSFEYGKTAAFLKINDELGFVESVNRNTSKKKIEGLSVGEYMLLIILGRSNGPLSKEATVRWFDESFLNYLWKFPHKLNSQNFLNNMDFITEKSMRQIEEDMSATMIQNGIKPTTIFWDGVNVFTYIENGEKLTRKGKSKEKRYDKNLVAFGIAESDENIPLMHETYPGNVSDAKIFPEIIEKIIERLNNLDIVTENMTLVFDKGNNSEYNINKVLENMHVVGSAKYNQVKQLMNVSLSEYIFLYKNSSGNNINGFRSKHILFGREFTIVVTHNPESHKKQEKKYETNKEKILMGLEELKKKSEKKHGRGRRITKKGLYANANRIISEDLTRIFKFEIYGEENPTFEYWINDVAEREFKMTFGKIVVFTDLHNASSVDIAQTYFAKDIVEKDFEFLKDKFLISVPPFYVRKDRRIRVHVFLCVMGMVFYRYLARKVKYLELSIKELDHQLKGIRVAFVSDKDTNQVSLVVEDMNTIQAKLFSVMGLGDFMI